MGSIGEGTRAIVRGRSGGWCEVRWGDGCTQVGESLHHLYGRADGGRNTSYNLVDACNWCHVEVHRPSNRDEAVARGLIRLSRSKAAAALARVVGADAVDWQNVGGPAPRASRRTRPVRIGERVVNVDAVDWTATERADELLEVLGLRTAQMAHAAA